MWLRYLKGCRFYIRFHKGSQMLNMRITSVTTHIKSAVQLLPNTLYYVLRNILHCLQPLIVGSGCIHLRVQIFQNGFDDMNDVYIKNSIWRGYLRTWLEFASWCLGFGAFFSGGENFHWGSQFYVHFSLLLY